MSRAINLSIIDYMTGEKIVDTNISRNTIPNEIYGNQTWSTNKFGKKIFLYIINHNLDLEKLKLDVFVLGYPDDLS